MSAPCPYDRRPTGEHDSVIKRWIIVREPGCVPEKKCPPHQSNLGAIAMIADLLDCRPPGTHLTLCELTWDHDLWASDGREELTIFNAIAVRKVKRQMHDLREKTS